MLNTFFSKFKNLELIFIIIFFSFISVHTQDELLIKRKHIFEFTKSPKIEKEGDKVYVSFESKGYCDVTIAIEDSNGKIIRHLASGVLGGNAPEPFQKNSLSQKILWDSKDDQGKYVLSYESLVVRISLGIKPYYEKSLYWSPKRRQGREAPILQATKEGVYVYDGGVGLDFVKLYNSEGTYIKTIYPFPGNKIKDVKGLHIRKMVDGKELPIKPTFLQQTFLTSGNYYGYENRKKDQLFSKNVTIDGHHYGMMGNASTFLAVKNHKVAIGMDYLARFGTDGSSAGMNFYGPQIALTAPRSKHNKNKLTTVNPRSGALSPDGKTLYLAGYHFCRFGHASADIITSGSWHSFHGVFKKNLGDDKKPTLFLGSDVFEKRGNDNKSFNVPAHVATDAKGNVYVSDHLNHRIQIFSSNGKLIKSLSVPNPSQVVIEPVTQKVYAVSSRVYVEGRVVRNVRKKKIQSKITVFSSFPKFKLESNYPLPKGFNKWTSPQYYLGNYGFPISVAVLKNKNETNVWLSREWARENVMSVNKGIARSNIQIYTITKGKLPDIK